MEISLKLEEFHSTIFFYNFAHAFRFCCRIIFCITKVRSPEQFLKYHFVRVLRADENHDFARSCMIIFNPYWIIKCPDVPLSLSFPRSFDHSGFCDVKCHFFDTNVCSVRHFVTLAPLRVVPVWRAKVFIRRKVFPLSRVTLPAEVRQLVHPRLSCSPRQLGDIHLNGCLNLQRHKEKLTRPG